ncbi:TetR/AcrR family transcriptional regulator [Roseivirga sp.]|uniref:TetR/AcrR family transcriptional regulator n=1 Tax=Roseivirga sp. TaxID=1964215 RepID=UPI002B27681D|nr:TetR/AcrR family transcriptional regulator [Roseivirga sp.]
MPFEKSERTKKRIIETVAPIFNKKGYQSTALSDITNATGLTKGAIYGNFGNKENLAEACFNHNVKFLQKGLQMTWAANPSSIAKLIGLLNFYHQNYETVANNGGCPLMNVAVEADDFYPFFKEKAKTILLTWQSEIASVIKEGQDSGEIKLEIDALSFANFYIASIEGGILIAKTTNNPASFFNIIENLKSLVNHQLKITT